MAVPTKIQHPLLRRPGTSQRKRIAESQLLRPEFALIDGRKLGDMLDFVYDYARLVVFHEYKIDTEGQSYVELSNWLVFFKKSLPFTLNRFAKSDFDRLETDLQSIIEAIVQKPNEASLRLLLDFCYFDLISPSNRLQQTARKFDFERLVTFLDRTARTSMLSPLRRFIELSNVAAKYFCTTKYNFMVFANVPWDVPIEELFVTDETVKDVPGGQAGAIKWLGARVAEAAQRLLVIQRNIAQEIPSFLNASIDVLEKRNDPHLGLLYAFFRLFEHFQGELNGLTQKHIEFFYTEVLQLKRRDMLSDQVHLVFEPVKHLKSYLIEQGTVFKDAKDSKNVDILFDLDEEIVIDKAKVAALKTLYLNHSQGCLEGNVSNNVPRAFVEGIYIATVANSADGKGGEFKEEQSKNWATLGAKLSKYTASGNVVPQNHPFGRIGFILASPVLWLNEGRRQVKISITCHAAGDPGNEDVLTHCFQELISKFNGDEESTTAIPSKLFHLEFSGEEGWFKPEEAVLFELKQNNQIVELIFDVMLGLNEPAVTFYDEDKIGEFFAAEPDNDRASKPSPFPMVKLELDPECQLECESNCTTDNCCLTKKNSENKVEVGLYHFMKHLRIQDIDIEVKVCGVKNILVQNEESLQDVNKPFLPFGARPKVGAEFTIGSKEVFCKHWEKFWLHFNWKDKPLDLEAHYKFYCNEDLEEDCTEVKNESFVFHAAVLEERLWKEWSVGPKPIFKDHFEEKSCLEMDEKKIPFGQEIGADDSSYYQEFRRELFPGLEYEPKSLKSGVLEPMRVNSDKGFFRMILDGMSFQHDRYPFVLARKMIELSGGLDPTSLGEIRKNLNIALAVHKLIADKIKELVDVIDNIDKVADDQDANSTLMELRKSANDLLTQMERTVSGGAIPPIPNFDELRGYLSDDLLDRISELTEYSGELRKIVDNHIDDALLTITIAVSVSRIQNNDPTPVFSESGLDQLLDRLNDALNKLNEWLGLTDEDVGLPKEPYTPLIKSLEVDYRATADKSDIELIHLHPFAKSSKTEVLTDNTAPTLLPIFTDEGTLFIGLEGLRPRSNLHLLFQFAEATVDSESDRAEIKWHYLVDNRWRELRTGFEILSDKTEQMTRSGIVKIALPDDISNEGNTLMPPTDEDQHLFWLKVSTPRAVAGVAELVGVHAQAALATYKPLDGSDRNRVAKNLEPEQIGKTFEPDFSIKKIQQPYKSFGGSVAESKGAIPIRMSELLRHKGRSVDVFDIEHLVLDAFPELFKCKCISHTMGLSANQYQRDLEVAPGFLIVAVVPDLTKLEPGDMLQPMAPVSTLTKVKKFLRMRVSPFARIRVMNPRYERIHVRMKVRLRSGRDRNYYLSQLKTDLRHFLAPWHLGDSDKLSFGQHLVYSDVLGFVEGLEYIDFVSDLSLFDFKSKLDELEENNTGLKEIVPLTARSILSPGDIEISSDEKDCNATPESQSNENKLAAFLESASPITCGEAQYNFAERKPQPIPMKKMRNDRRN